jgi:ureidoglycolate amidohydrolase
VRDIDVARRNGVLAELARTCLAVSGRRGVAIRTEMLNSDPPALCAPELLEALSAACAKHAISNRRMVSRAYHDSLFMARIAPVAMLFIPCRNGVSHRPDEYASAEAIAAGALVLAETLAAVAV